MKKILIAYYSWSGHTSALAAQLQAFTQAETYKIDVPAGTFSTDMYETSDQAKAQRQSGQLPTLTEPLPDVAQYDVILVGGPVWSGALSTPVLSFLAALPDSPAVLAPFYTDAGDAGNYEADFKRVAGAHLVAPGLDSAHPRVASAQLQRWLEQFN
ncbi:flavodoxin [Lacticaseibacillus porcinae]|uniref:flavodoxin n=1 Tax=Lacticaseibacillus porcinae TaxID=1123687 RepID=UPI0013DE2121|nr:flavodoxin [Lacticaseibacillus porcinae]